MQIAFYLVLLLVGLGAALLASELAVAYTRALAVGLGAPPFVIGVVLVAVGTDLPEIANSITSHLQGEGDVNVGDSVGSTLTQYTFVLGLFPLIAGTLVISRLQVGLVTVLTMGGLGLTTLFVLDGHLNRAEGLALIAAWAAATVVMTKLLSHGAADDPPAVRHDGKLAQALVALGALGLVAVGATSRSIRLSVSRRASGSRSFCSRSSAPPSARRCRRSWSTSPLSAAARPGSRSATRSAAR